MGNLFIIISLKTINATQSEIPGRRKKKIKRTRKNRNKKTER